MNKSFIAELCEYLLYDMAEQIARYSATPVFQTHCHELARILDCHPSEMEDLLLFISHEVLEEVDREIPITGREASRAATERDE